MKARPRKGNRGGSINDLPYPVRQGGILCPYYKKWMHMLDRSYSYRYNYPESSYYGTYVCDEWLKASSFKDWMEKQVWQGLELDKDILVKGNKVYSPETCCFVPKKINVYFLASVLVKSKMDRSLPLGSHIRVYDGVKTRSIDYICNCGGKYLGIFKDPFDAHKAWQEQKVKDIRDIVSWWKSDEKYGMSYQQNVADVLLNRAIIIENQYNKGEVTWDY